VTVRVYLDAAPVIYLVEQVPQYVELVERRVSADSVAQVVSDLTRLECRVKPLREGDIDLLQDYDDYFAEAIEETIALSRIVIDRATDIRAHYGFKTPDAIHLAAALASRCDRFLTNDHRLDRFPEITIDVLQSP
jgi:predicted nucleic acid-binding protein